VSDTRFRVYASKSCLCSGSVGALCWQARCNACGAPLTKHAFTEDDARAEAVHALDQPGHFQHRCKARRAA
jgi:hypothetical protein